MFKSFDTEVLSLVLTPRWSGGFWAPPIMDVSLIWAHYIYIVAASFNILSQFFQWKLIHLNSNLHLNLGLKLAVAPSFGHPTFPAEQILYPQSSASTGNICTFHPHCSAWIIIGSSAHMPCKPDLPRAQHIACLTLTMLLCGHPIQRVVFLYSGCQTFHD